MKSFLVVMMVLGAAAAAVLWSDSSTRATRAAVQEADGDGGGGGGADPKLKADMKNREATRAKMKKAAQSPQFKAAVKKVAAATGKEPAPLETAAEGEDTGGFVFAPVPHAKANELLSAKSPLRTQLLAQGFTLFRFQNSHGMRFDNQEMPDSLAILPTKDKYDVLAAVETEGPNSGKYNGVVIAYLRELEKTNPFELIDAGTEHLMLRFTQPVKDPAALAKKIHGELCEDVEEEKMRETIKKGELFLWWD